MAVYGLSNFENCFKTRCDDNNAKIKILITTKYKFTHYTELFKNVQRAYVVASVKMAVKVEKISLW